MVGLTEFESCALATIREHQPCSAYEVRQVFARSTTPAWSGSTGSIYPAIERLLRRGLVQSETQEGDQRGRKNLKVTPEGEAAVLSWVMDLEPWVAKATPDPIRTRVSFLDALGTDLQRAAFFARAEALTTDMLLELKLHLEAEGPWSRCERAAGLGALYQLEARLNWLGDARQIFEAAPAESQLL
jgi:DNA-binding PadR family transcriptional regulator